MTTIQQPKNKTPAEVGADNWMLAMMKAVERDQNSMANIQIEDSKSAEETVKLEGDIYEHWYGSNGVLEQQAQVIQKAKKASQIQKAQATYSLESSEAQMNTSRQDGSVQAAQGQVSTDATNLQMKAQMIQPINQLIAALANMTDKIIA